jgi:hypothetical protein
VDPALMQGSEQVTQITDTIVDKTLFTTETYWVPGIVKLRPFSTREVFCPPTTAIGDTKVNSGVFHVLHDFDKRVIPEII